MQYHHQDLSSVRHRILRRHLRPHSCGQWHDRRRTEKHIWLLLCTSPAVPLDSAGALAGHHAWGLLPGPPLWRTGVPLPCPCPAPAPALPCPVPLPCLCGVLVCLYPALALPLLLSCAPALPCPAFDSTTSCPLTVVCWCASATSSFCLQT